MIVNTKPIEEAVLKAISYKEFLNPTVGELRRFLENIPDNTKVSICGASRMITHVENNENSSYLILDDEDTDLYTRKRPIKIFISQPMNGLTDEEIHYNRACAVNRLDMVFKNLGINYEIIDNFQESIDIPEKTKRPQLLYLSNDFIKLSTADLMVALNGCEKAHGCIIELQAAKEYNIPVVYENELPLDKAYDDFVRTVLL